MTKDINTCDPVVLRVLIELYYVDLFFIDSMQVHDYSEKHK